MNSEQQYDIVIGSHDRYKYNYSGTYEKCIDFLTDHTMAFYVNNSDLQSPSRDKVRSYYEDTWSVSSDIDRDYIDTYETTEDNSDSYYIVY
jgi:hypothetical protein